MTCVALVSEHASPLAVLGGTDAGGQNVYVAHLARALGALGHDVVVYTRRDDPATPDRVSLAPNVVVEHLRAGPPGPLDKDRMFPYMDDFAVGLRRGLIASRAEVVHAHFWMSGYASLEAASDLGLPVVQTFHALGSVKRRHQGDADTSPPEREAVERRLVAEADRIIATCSDEHRELEAIGCRGDRVSIVPAGFDATVFHPRTTARWFEVDRRERPIELVAVSRLVPRKGLADAVRAVASLDDVRLTVIGGPPRHGLAADPHHRELCELAGDLGAAGRVHFTGGLAPERVAALLREADLFVAAPWYEPFGIAPVEAMGCGLPVIGTAVGGLLDTVVDGGTGTLVPPHDPGALAAAVDDLARRPELRHELGSRASWRAHRRFAWGAVARGVAEVYRRTTIGRRSRECRA